MIVWIDIETSDFDERISYLFEVAIVVTDDKLFELAAKNVIIKPTCSINDIKMPDIVRKMHTNNGLFEDISKIGISLLEAEERLLDFTERIEAWQMVDLREVPMAGSCVGFDRRWIRYFIPKFEDLFHHTSIDISSINQLAKRWSKNIWENRPKAEVHRALADTRESIETLKYYRNAGFIGNVLNVQVYP